MKILDWETLVPTTKVNTVRKAFEGAFGTTEIDDIAPLTSGRSSALVYKVAVKQKAYVMRLVMHIDELTDPVRQFVCLNAAARAGIAPPVRYTNADDAISIVDFIEHTPITARFTADKELFSELAASIKLIHALPLFPRLVGFLDGVDELLKRYKGLGLLPETATDEHFRYYAAVQRVYPRQDEDIVSSHNDLNPGNVLHNSGKIWIIDWETAFANDRYLDLAIVNTFFGSGERGEEALLETYFGESLNDYRRARFFLMQQVCFMYYAMIFLYLTSITRNSGSVLSASMETMRLREFHTKLGTGEIAMVCAEEYLLYAKVLLNESLLQMKTVRFQGAIRLMELNGLLPR